uniref:EF-hand domain-containing family member B isoform X2 n=1 Tax=Petromyzon marinus TaxID=7757 RepID=A0AAJ7SXR9_PETMA|nr:EF-hand domain-containing family member B isoform X2 [Petromyzon marinus]
MFDLRPIYQGEFIDRTPGIRSAGKFRPAGDRASQCLSHSDAQVSTPVRVRVNSSVASSLVHGVRSRPSLSVGELLSPRPSSALHQRSLEQREGFWWGGAHAPLGRSSQRGPGLPTGLHPYTTTFGRSTASEFSAGEVINPPKSWDKVDSEYQKGHDLYVRSHNSYHVGEVIDRGYDWSCFGRDSRFGRATPHHADGRSVAHAQTWIQNTSKQLKRLEDFRRRTRPKLGKVLDPIADTLDVPPDHTFGLPVEPDKYGAGDLVHRRPRHEWLRGSERQRALLAAVRHCLKVANYNSFPSLLDAFRHYDRNGDGKIDSEELQVACSELNLPVEAALLQDLVRYCDVDRDGFINYLEFANFLNWKQALPLSPQEERAVNGDEGNVAASMESTHGRDKRGKSSMGLIEPQGLVPRAPNVPSFTPFNLTKQVDRMHGRYCTSSSLVNSAIGRASSAGWHTFGVPSVRTDLPAPRVRHFGDRTNYGEESDVSGLLNPSVYALHGVYEADFLTPRSPSQIQQILRNAGVELSDGAFEDAWTTAAVQDPRREVSVESFRRALGMAS